jgi:hypothetical protein
MSVSSREGAAPAAATGEAVAAAGRAHGVVVDNVNVSALL